jgi:hypothetical protein
VHNLPITLYHRDLGIARVEEWGNGGNGRFLKKAPQKLLDCAAGFCSGYDIEGEFFDGSVR